MQTIVLVEDDAAIQDVISIALDNDYKVNAYRSGECILKNQIERPDMFLLDKNLAGTNGLDICRFMKENESYKGVPVIILSASPDIKRMAENAGADDAIAKPFNLKTLRETISKYLIN